MREWRALIAHRQALVTQRVAAQNRIRAILVGQGLPAPRGARAWTAAGLAGIAQFARPLAECGPDELWRGMLDPALTAYRQAGELVAVAEARLDALGKADRRVQLLDTVPGLGPRTAEAVVAHLDDPRRFKSGKQVAAYGGLVPRQYQSGEDDRRGRITKRGPAVLRKLLVQCAWAMLRYNRWARAVFDRLSRGKARRKQAVVALPGRCWSGAGPCCGTGSRGGPTRSRRRRRLTAARTREGRPRRPRAPTGAGRASPKLLVPGAACPPEGGRTNGRRGGYQLAGTAPLARVDACRSPNSRVRPDGDLGPRVSEPHGRRGRGRCLSRPPRQRRASGVGGTNNAGDLARLS